MHYVSVASFYASSYIIQKNNIFFSPAHREGSRNTNPFFNKPTFCDYMQKAQVESIWANCNT